MWGWEVMQGEQFFYMQMRAKIFLESKSEEGNVESNRLLCKTAFYSYQSWANSCFPSIYEEQECKNCASGEPVQDSSDESRS